MFLKQMVQCMIWTPISLIQIDYYLTLVSVQILGESIKVHKFNNLMKTFKS